MGRLDRELQAEEGLSLAWYDVLLHLDEVPGRRLRMTDLAAAVVISKSGLTSLVDRMEEAGLVAREPDPDDRRAIAVALTAAGRERFAQAAKVHRRGIREHFSDHLTAEEGQRLVDSLARLLRSSERQD